LISVAELTGDTNLATGKLNLNLHIRVVAIFNRE